MKEVWKDIPRYEGLYRVSDMGRVKSLNRTIKRKDGRKILLRGRVLKQYAIRSGYLMVSLCKDCKANHELVHRLVLYAFVGKKSLDCNHINGDKTKNELTNLEYCTKSQNIKHAFDLGIKDYVGDKHPGKKLSSEKVLQIRSLYLSGKYSHSDLAKMFKVSKPNISSIVNRRTWSHI